MSRRPTVFKVRALHNGGHVHVSFFAKEKGNATYILLGKLVMSEAEYTDFMTKFESDEWEDYR